jgi:hypothetical protein
MTELVLTALYYGLWLALFLVIALLVSSLYFLLKYAWERGWVKKAGQGIKRFAIWSWPYVKRFSLFLTRTLVRFLKWLPPQLSRMGRKLVKLPSGTGKAIVWLVKKTWSIFKIACILSLLATAVVIFTWAFHINTQELFLVDFVKFGTMTIAVITGLFAALRLVKEFAG